MLRPEVRGYRPSGGVELYATFQCGLAIAFAIIVAVFLFAPAVNDHMRAMTAFRRSRRIARRAGARRTLELAEQVTRRAS